MQLAAILRSTSLTWLSRGLHLGGIVCLLAIVVIGWQMRLHLAGQAEAAVNLGERTRATLKTEKKTREQLAALELELSACRTAVAQLSNKLVHGPQESRFIAHLGQFAEETGIEIRNFRPGRMLHRGALDEVELQISCVGSYEGLCTFLAAQEELPRFCHVAGMTVASQPAGGELHFDLTLQLLFKGAAASQQTADTAMKKQP